MIRNKLKFLVLFASILFGSCAYKVDKNPASPSTLGSDKPKAPLTFSLVEQNVFEQKCLSCHSNATRNSGGVNLETYSNVMAHLNDIKDDVTAGDMPKSPGVPLTNEEKFLLLQWIQNGAPEVTPVEPTPTPAPTPVPTPQPVIVDPPTPGLLPTFTSINTLIFKPKCVSCHSADGEESDVPFEQYRDFVKGGIITPNDPTKSSIIKHITAGAKKLMPPPKSKINAIAPEDIAIIDQWILGGALNN